MFRLCSILALQGLVSISGIESTCYITRQWGVPSRRCASNLRLGIGKRLKGQPRGLHALCAASQR